MNYIGISLKDEDQSKGPPLRKCVLMRCMHPARVFVVGAMGTRFEEWSKDFKDSIDIVRFDEFLNQLAKVQTLVTAQKSSHAGQLMMQVMMMAIGSTQVFRNFFSMVAKKINHNLETFSDKTVVVQVPPLQCAKMYEGIKNFQGHLKVSIFFLRMPNASDFEKNWIF